MRMYSATVQMENATPPSYAKDESSYTSHIKRKENRGNQVTERQAPAAVGRWEPQDAGHRHAPASCTYYRKEYDGQTIFRVSGFRDNCWYGELPGS